MEGSDWPTVNATTKLGPNASASLSTIEEEEESLPLSGKF